MVTVSSGNNSQASCAPSCPRFGANSPGNRPGKFAHPRPAQPELRQHLVPGEGAGGAAGEAATAGGARGCQGWGSSLLGWGFVPGPGTQQREAGSECTVTPLALSCASFKAEPAASL